MKSKVKPCLLDRIDRNKLVSMPFDGIFLWFKEIFPDCHVWKQTRKGRYIWVKLGNEIMLLNDGRVE